ncbi:MAG: hypothetical protein MJ091_00855 [Clostridia bacterium]|nr:hypothetical protein [Clostridia bacterium]
MDNKYYSGVIAEMQDFFDENGFTVNKDNEYTSASKAVKVEYNEEKQTYELYMAEINENEKGEYALASSWLFDDSQTEKDAGSVGIDFVNTLRDSMGIKVKRTVSSASSVDLPTASADGSMKTAGFAKKVLDVYPQYKDAYKEHIAKYGNFLYMEFFAETFIPTITEVLRKGEKKQMKKLYELLENAYTTGDRETVNIVVASLAAAVLKDETLKEKADELLAEDSHFKASLNAFIPVLKADKKLFAALVK